MTEVTEYDEWYNRQILRSVEILQSTTEFAALRKSGTATTAFAEVNELVKQLTSHEEDLLKYIEGLNWKSGRIPHVYRYFDDAFHKLDARRPHPAARSRTLHVLVLVLIEGRGDHGDQQGQD